MAATRSDRIAPPAGLQRGREGNRPDKHRIELPCQRRRGIGLEGPARVTALIPAGGLLDTREVPPSRDAARGERVALAWTSLLGDILEEDRADHVGGTIGVRPVVAAR